MNKKLFFSKIPWGFFLLLIAMAPLTSGCFLKSMAVDTVADSLSGTGDTFAADNDPELIREAVPFSLKLMESVLSATPRHVGLLTAACKGFTEYGYAFLQADSEYLADAQYEKSKELNQRARKIYVRGRDYGLRGLDVRHSKFSQFLKTDPKAAVAKAKKEDIELLYWTGLSWMAAISIGKDDPELVSNVPQAEALVYRAYELNPDYDKGSIHDFLITYEGSKPAMMGGSVKKAKEHFKRALELNKGERASSYVNYAEAVSRQAQNQEEFEEMLNKALAVDPDKNPSDRLVNLITQKRARWLLANLDQIFAK
jgi:predicted anti-sigma-YlaC factor YlaD